jgi:phospholipid-transporting ATPase
MTTTATATRFSGAIVCEKPNRNIYGFTAFAELDGSKSTVPLAPTNVILRGCELKNTAWAVGVAVYTGQETKVMLNNAGARSKSSRLERRMNRETIWLSVFLFGCCFGSGLGMGLWLKRHESQLDALPYYGKTKANVYGYYGVFGEAVFAFLSSLISLQIMIPISLYISMELVRLGQSYFMINDAGMYHAESDTRLQCRDLSISEDLGQVQYIFSDKTGTLTENKMELRRLSVFGDSYGAVAPPEEAANGERVCLHTTPKNASIFRSFVPSGRNGLSNIDLSYLCPQRKKRAIEHQSFDPVPATKCGLSKSVFRSCPQ